MGLLSSSIFQRRSLNKSASAFVRGGLWAALTLLIELSGSALILSGYAVWLGAGALGCLTAIAMLKADKFWTKSGAERLTQANTFFEHLGLIGGFVLIALIYVS